MDEAAEGARRVEELIRSGATAETIADELIAQGHHAVTEPAAHALPGEIWRSMREDPDGLEAWDPTTAIAAIQLAIVRGDISAADYRVIFERITRATGAPVAEGQVPATTQIQSLVMLNRRDEKGTMLRSISLSRSGELSVAGHDLGPGVTELLGSSEHEFVRTYSKAETDKLRELLGVAPTTDFLAAVRDRFTTTHALEAFLAHEGMTGAFWSRTGD